MHFEIIGDIEDVETLAVGGRIRDIMRIQKQFGPGRWRKLKGVTKVRLQSGRICNAEVHWYEAHGIGRKKMKIKKLLD
jgi:hypothetical protein